MALFSATSAATFTPQNRERFFFFMAIPAFGHSSRMRSRICFPRFFLVVLLYAFVR